MNPKAPSRPMSHPARVILAVLLLAIAWPHTIVPLGLAVAAAVGGVTATHLPVVVTVAAVWLLARTLPRRTIARLAGRRAARVPAGGAAQ